MKCLQIFPVITVLFLAGCEYESPLTREHTIPIDSAVLGLWELIPDEEEERDQRMMVLKYSETEYLIHYPIGADGVYFRGYPIKVGNVSCVQLEVVGTEDGPLSGDERELFHVVSYQLGTSELTIKMLNTDLVDDELNDSEALKKAFLEHQNSKDLFTNPAKFRKIKGKSYILRHK